MAQLTAEVANVALTWVIAEGLVESESSRSAAAQPIRELNYCGRRSVFSRQVLSSRIQLPVSVWRTCVIVSSLPLPAARRRYTYWGTARAPLFDGITNGDITWKRIEAVDYELLEYFLSCT